jgi:hypothetical protein
MKKLFLVSVLSLVVASLAAQTQERKPLKGRVLTQQGRVAATPTPTPASEDQKTISDGKGKMPAYGKEAAITPTPGGKTDQPTGAKENKPAPGGSKQSTPAPRVDSTNLNGSRSNSYRVRPTLTPTAPKKEVPPSARAR